jgi:2,3-bisphosphoglycerate-dependent phosphoglycerate mutase
MSSGKRFPNTSSYFCYGAGMKRLIFLLLLLVLAATGSAQPVVIVIRHAEKATTGGNDPDLSAAGRARSEMLARLLKDAGLTAVFTSEFKRTRETAVPLAKSIGVTPTVVPAQDTTALVAKLHQLDGNALVVGHGNTIPKLVKELGIETTINIPEDDYTELFVVVLGDKPQLLRLHFP